MGCAQRYVVGLDLGPAQEYTSLAVLQRRLVMPHDSAEQRRPPYALRYLHRFPLGTPYAAIAAAVRELINKAPLPGCELVVDRTGVGQAVLRLLADAWINRLTCTIKHVKLVAGQETDISEAGIWQMPKNELVGVLQVLLQTRRLQISNTLPDAALLVKELESFKAKPPTLKADSLDLWREGAHDDLILAVALAAYFGERALPALFEPPPPISNLLML
jgi:hypothetical protein